MSAPDDGRIDYTRDLAGRTCPACHEARVRVVERAGLVLLSCGSGCPGQRIRGAAALAPLPSRPLEAARPREVPTLGTCERDQPAPALLPGLDPFDRFLARLNVAPGLGLALETLLAAEAGSDLPWRGSLQEGVALLTREPEARAERSPLEKTADAIAGVLLEGVLAAAPGRRAEAAGLLQAVARFAARGQDAAPARRAA